MSGAISVAPKCWFLKSRRAGDVAYSVEYLGSMHEESLDSVPNAAQSHVGWRWCMLVITAVGG